MGRKYFQYLLIDQWIDKIKRKKQKRKYSEPNYICWTQKWTYIQLKNRYMIIWMYGSINMLGTFNKLLMNTFYPCRIEIKYLVLYSFWNKNHCLYPILIIVIELLLLFQVREVNAYMLTYKWNVLVYFCGFLKFY